MPRPRDTSRVTTYSSTSVRRLRASSALMTPTIARSTGLRNSAWISIGASDLVVVEVGRPVVRVVDARARQRAEEPQLGPAAGVLRVLAGEEDHHGVTEHRGLERLEDGVRAKERVYAS